MWVRWNVLIKRHRSFLFFFEFSLLLGSGILILLILRNEVVHVGFGFCELHLVHTLASVPMQEGFSSEHGSELLSHSFEHLLNGSGVADEGDGHLESLGGDVADGGFDVVGDPLDEVGRVFVLDVQHLLVDFFG